MHIHRLVRRVFARTGHVAFFFLPVDQCFMPKDSHCHGCTVFTQSAAGRREDVENKGAQHEG